ncbi:MAG TPA: hypothetical protein VJH37_01385 [Candidatus Nanoarchaeia archaeon]|nr:hypothetical protein [Candidatus Nanoarchaeia archaeon]
MIHIGFDIDGVLADFAGAFVPWYNERHGTAFVETDFWTHEWWKVFGVPKEQLNAEITLFVETPHAESIQPYEGMPAIVQHLAEIYQHLSQVSARFTPQTRQRTQAFSDIHYPGCFSTLHLPYHPQTNPHGHKGLVCRDQGIVILVEDQINYVDDALAHGVQAILIRRPWNIREQVPVSVPRIDIQDLEDTIASMLNGKQH